MINFLSVLKRILIITFIFNNANVKAQDFEFNDDSDLFLQNIMVTGAQGVFIKNNVSPGQSKVNIGAIATEQGDILINNNSGDLSVANIYSRNGGSVILKNSDKARIFFSFLGRDAIYNSRINLGSSPNSRIDLEGGELNAIVAMNNQSQEFRFDGGVMKGVVYGAGTVVVDAKKVDLTHSIGLHGKTDIKVNEGNQIDASKVTLKAKNVTLAQGSVLDVRSLAGIQNIDGVSDGQGILNIRSSQGFETGIGSKNSLSEVNIENNRYLMSFSSVRSENINVGNEKGGSSFYLRANQGNNYLNLIEGDVNLHGSSGLYSQGPSEIRGDINAESNAKSAIIIQALDGRQGFKVHGNIGAEGKNISHIQIDPYAAFESVGGDVYANKIQAKKGSILKFTSSNIHAPIITDEDNSVNVTIQGSSSLNRDIASAEKKLAKFEVAAGSSLEIRNSSLHLHKLELQNSSVIILGENSQINAESIIQNSSSISLSGRNVMLNADVVGDGSSVIDLGRGNSKFNSDMILKPGDAIAFEVVDAEKSGNLDVKGSAMVPSGVLMKVKISAKDFYRSLEKDYRIISGAKSSKISKIADKNIDVNNSGLNQVGLITVSSYVKEEERGASNQLFAKLSVKDAPRKIPGISSVSQTQSVFSAINKVGLRSKGDLSKMQDYLIVGNITSKQREKALSSMTPNNVGIRQGGIAISSAGVKSAQTRIEQLHSITANEEKSGFKTVDSLGNEVDGADDSSTAQSHASRASDVFYDDFDPKKALWAQIIGSKTKQADQDGFYGYQARLYGLALGADRTIDKDTIIGISLALSNLKIDSSDNLKSSNVDSYQLTFYAEKMFTNRFFLDGYASAAINRYDSSRAIPVVAKTAQAKYQGQTYFSKLRSGYLYKFKNGFEISPEASLSYARNSIEDYFESGASTLDLAVKTQDSQMLEGEIAVSLNKKSKIPQIDLKIAKIPSFTVDPKIRIAFAHDFIGDRPVSSSNFIGQGANFVTEGSKVDRNTLRLSGGLNLYSSSDFLVSVNYTQERKEHYKSHFGLFKLRWEF